MPIRAIFATGQTEITVNGLHQWDYGQKLEIYSSELPTVVEVHFACVGMTEAIVRACETTPGKATATIPDRCLEQTTPITAWVFEINESSGTTTKKITLPIEARVRPSVAEDIPEEVADKYTEAVNAINKATADLKNGAIVAKQAENASAAQEANHATSAGHADTAGSAGHATSAGHADTARSADLATEAEGLKNQVRHLANYTSFKNVIAPGKAYVITARPSSGGGWNTWSILPIYRGEDDDFGGNVKSPAALNGDYITYNDYNQTLTFYDKDTTVYTPTDVFIREL